MGTIIVGIVVFGVIAAIAARLVVNARAGKSNCSCGGACSACGKGASKEAPSQEAAAGAA